jgi:AraC-like DNA-binding protein
MGTVINLRDIKTLGMSDTAGHLDFDIREQNVRPGQSSPHRHEYFQIQINLAGNTHQTVGGSVRPFRRGCLSFILPHRVHFIPHPAGSRYVIINIAQRFLRPDLDIDPLDLEDVPIAKAPEFAPFLFQEYIDFDFAAADFAEIEQLIERLYAENAARRFGSLELIRGLLLQLIGLVCRKHESEILRLAAGQAQQTSRRDALQRVAHYIRAHLTEEVALADAAAAAFLSPNYLAHLLKKDTGKTFTELVTERRMERAQELLANSSARIADVAHASGFADEAYFTRRFKQWFGQSPRTYRDSVRASISSPR